MRLGRTQAFTTFRTRNLDLSGRLSSPPLSLAVLVCYSVVVTRNTIVSRCFLLFISPIVKNQIPTCHGFRACSPGVLFNAEAFYMDEVSVIVTLRVLIFLSLWEGVY